MEREHSKRLVIDASVARAAGETIHPISMACRQFLDHALSICHRVVMSGELRAEWDRHRSRYSSAWLAAMKGRKKYVGIEHSRNDGLSSAIHDLESVSEVQRTAMQKDVHLLEAALATDRIIVSLDRTVEALYRHAVNSIELLEQIIWVDPTQDSQQVLDWLKLGAPAGQQWTLRSRQG